VGATAEFCGTRQGKAGDKLLVVHLKEAAVSNCPGLPTACSRLSGIVQRRSKQCGKSALEDLLLNVPRDVRRRELPFKLLVEIPATCGDIFVYLAVAVERARVPLVVGYEGLRPIASKS
jgi:hypothetical protein